jgi:hypothetical protein
MTAPLRTSVVDLKFLYCRGKLLGELQIQNHTGIINLRVSL